MAIVINNSVGNNRVTRLLEINNRILKVTIKLVIPTKILITRTLISDNNLLSSIILFYLFINHKYLISNLNS
jgi:hypothetical protein